VGKEKKREKSQPVKDRNVKQNQSIAKQSIGKESKLKLNWKMIIKSVRVKFRVVKISVV